MIIGPLLKFHGTRDILRLRHVKGTFQLGDHADLILLEQIDAPGSWSVPHVRGGTDTDTIQPAQDWSQFIELTQSRPRYQRYDSWVGIEAVRLDRQVVRTEMEQARQTFHHLLDSATVAELSRRSNGTRWTNGQLLFHMLFGYLIVVRLLVIVRVFGRLPDGFSRVFASALEASTRPFHAINYFGSLGGPRLLGYAGMGRRFDKVVAKLLRHLDRESDSELMRGMHYPPSWDPYFKAYMTLADIYRYPTQHFEHHRRQLTLDESY